MSVSDWGYILFEGKEYGVLSSELSDEIMEKLKKYQRKNDSHSNDTACTTSKSDIHNGNDDLEELIDRFYEDVYTPPWGSNMEWCIENNQLFLTRLCTDEIHKEVFGSEKRVLADWVSEVKLLVKHRRVCKTYEKNGSYLNKMEILHLSLNQGNIVDKRNETELYTSIEMKNYIDNEEENEITWSPPYATLRIESMKFLDYLDDKTTQQAEDQVFPAMSNFIEQMIQKGGKEDISLSAEDVKSVLKEGEVAVFASAKGSDIDEMVASLTYSMTDEVLEAKGCLMHLTMNKDYPMSNIENIVNGFENKLGFANEDSVDAYFIFGTRLNDEMDESEVLIRVLLGV